MKKYNLKINKNEYEVEVVGVNNEKAEVKVNGEVYLVEFSQVEEENDNQKQAVSSTANASDQAVKNDTVAQNSGNTNAVAVTSPLPGVIVEVSVKVGDTVKAGDKVAVLEAMKMENEIQASKDGVIASVAVTKGDSLMEGDTIVTIS